MTRVRLVSSCALVALALSINGVDALGGGRVSSGPLSDADIRDAVELGMFGDVRPYELHETDVGFVYTPFLRVAFAVKAALLQGRVLSDSEVRSVAMERSVYIAFTLECCPPEGGAAGDSVEIRATWVLPPPSRSSLSVEEAGKVGFWWLRGSPPLWLRLGAEALTDFGAEPPKANIVAVAGFPLTSLRTDHVFVIYRTWPARGTPGPLNGMIEHGRILPEDLERWR